MGLFLDMALTRPAQGAYSKSLPEAPTTSFPSGFYSVNYYYPYASAALFMHTYYARIRHA
jgi:hypothetical protein